ncbi:MAG: YfhO family protein [Deltaproteobacteria bacterium]|nr:YfhO family protein [Deltaproteobacteria bacterium]
MATFFVPIYLALLSCGLFYSALSGAYLLTERDLSVFFIPPRLLWVEAVKNGEVPLWNPYSYSGHPLLATLQPGIFYPPDALLLALPFDTAFNWTIIIHFFLAGSFTFLLLREMECGKAGSLAGALVFMLSGYLFSAHNVISTLFSVAWVPLAILLFRRAVGRGSCLYGVLTGVTLTVMFTAGGIEVLLGTAGLLLIMTLMPSVMDFGGSSPAGLKRRSALFVLSMAVFVLLSAVQLLPFVELARSSTRAGGLSYFEATTWSFDLKDFIQFFIPDPYGYGVSDEKYWANQSWLKTVYTGVIPFALSAFFFLRERRKAWPFLFTGLLYLSLAMGRNNLFYHYLYEWAPFFNKFRYPVKFLFVPFLFLSVSTGLGYDRLKEGIEKKDGGARRMVRLLLGLSTVAALTFGLLDLFGPDIKAFLVNRGTDFPEYNHVEINLFNAKRLLFFFIIFSIALYGCFSSERLLKKLPYAVIALLSIDLFFAHNGYYGSMRAGEYHRKSEVMDFVSKDKGLFRVFVTPRTMSEGVEIKDAGSFDGALMKSMDLDKERLTGYNLPAHIFDISGIEVMRRGDYTNLFSIMASRKGADSTNILSMLNVKYVVSIPEIASPEFVLRKVVGAANNRTRGLEGERAVKVYENINYLPRFFIARKYRVIKRAEEYVEILPDKKFSPGSEVLLEEEPRSDIRPGASGGPKDSIEVVSYRNNSIELKVVSGTPGILVASESYYPGWKAYVDGKEERILKADYILRGVPLDRGAHSVRFVYRPWTFTAGAYVSGAAVFGLLALGAARARRRR